MEIDTTPDTCEPAVLQPYPGAAHGVMISGTWIRYLSQELQPVSVPLQARFATNLAPTLPLADCIALFCQAQATLVRQDMGLYIGSTIELPMLGPLGVAIGSCATVAEAVELLYEFGPRFAPFLVLHREQRSSSLALVVEILNGKGKQSAAAVEIVMLCIFNIFKSLLGKRTRHLIYHFSYARPSHGNRYEAFLDGYTQFNASFCGIGIPLDYMPCPIATANPDTYQKAINLLQREQANTDTSFGFTDAVRHRIRSRDTRIPAIAETASALQTSPRAFRQRLRHSNTSFRTLLAEEQEAKATHLLLNSDKSVKEIAYVLGYSDTSSFSRVFRQWTGESPLQYRRAARMPKHRNPLGTLGELM